MVSLIGKSLYYINKFFPIYSTSITTYCYVPSLEKGTFRQSHFYLKPSFLSIIRNMLGLGTENDINKHA